MLRPFYIALLEVKRYLSDAGDLALSLALPIALFALMYATFGGSTGFNGTANVVNEDGGPRAQEFIDRLSAVSEVDVDLMARDEAETKLDRSGIVMAMFIPEDFHYIDWFLTRLLN